MIAPYIVLTASSADPQLQTILTAVLASIAYSITFFVKKRSGKNIQSFDTKKFISTLLVGIGVGVSMSLSGANLTFLSFEAELATMAGIIALVESVLKTIYREVKKRTEQSK